ncbi:flagellar basal-body rod protein FlgF [Sphingomonas guangdongensis]|uniref:Flagellar basal-body rod protein FlgF n=1 Tax=Sphingomonas guangdongensis TaxID=1141890 RepID=A0A285QJE8_9SPHN|nr:flagellar basal-body rod protein FlgF [Sphingomonas guangdongensis]SOB80202.1 flagellar basal-body rod protein FlgF [Sphingomonas guangdongensis]
MDRMVYTALSGLKSQMSAQAAIANNIANAATTGFRADRVSFQQMMLKGGTGHESRAASSEEVKDADRRAGSIQQTGRDLDIAIPGASWMAVQATDGTEAYTRRGDLRITESGVLETGDGFPVMGSGGPITVPPAQKVMISDDGTLSIIPMGAEPGAPAQVIDRIRLASAEGTDTVKGLDNLLHVRGGGVLPEDMNAKVQVGALEQSNVNLTEALVDMIENQRSYEIQGSLLKEAKSLDESSASLMRLPG